MSRAGLHSSIFAFLDERPAIELGGVEEERHRLLVKLDTGNLDLLILSDAIDRPNFQQLDLWSERMFAALPHGLVTRDRIFWSDLHGETFLAPKMTGDAIRSMIQAQLAGSATEPTITVTDVSRETVLSTVGAGRAVTTSRRPPGYLAAGGPVR